MTVFPSSKKLVKHDAGLLLTSTVVTLCALEQWCNSVLVVLGVHHFNVSVV